MHAELEMRKFIKLKDEIRKIAEKGIV